MQKSLTLISAIALTLTGCAVNPSLPDLTDQVAVDEPVKIFDSKPSADLTTPVSHIKYNVYEDGSAYYLTTTGNTCGITVEDTAKVFQGGTSNTCLTAPPTAQQIGFFTATHHQDGSFVLIEVSKLDGHTFQRNCDFPSPDAALAAFETEKTEQFCQTFSGE